MRSAFFEMELDHDSGAMRGRVLAGRYQGADFGSLDVETLVSVLAEVDEESRALLMAYLDRRDPGWSENAQADAADRPRASGTGKMSEQEAYQILGLQPGATADDYQPRASHADEETASRPRGVDVSRGPYQRSQGNSSPPPSLRYSTNTTISGSCVLAHPIVVFVCQFFSSMHGMSLRLRCLQAASA